MIDYDVYIHVLSLAIIICAVHGVLYSDMFQAVLLCVQHGMSVMEHVLQCMIEL